MNFRDDIFSHQENLWVLCLGEEHEEGILSPLFDVIDWFNNQILTKALLNSKLSLKFGDKTIIATSGLLPVKKLLIYGLGKEEDLKKIPTLKFLQDLSADIEHLREISPWILFSNKVPEKFVEEFSKSRQTFDVLAHSKIAAG